MKPDPEDYTDPIGDDRDDREWTEAQFLAHDEAEARTEDYLRSPQAKEFIALVSAPARRQNYLASHGLCIDCGLEPVNDPGDRCPSCAAACAEYACER